MSTTPHDPFASGTPDGQPPQPQYAQTQYTQPQYPQAQYPHAYPPPAAGRPPYQAKNWMGVTSLILSILGFFTGITAIGGIIFGHLGLSAAKRGEADNRGLSLGGLITGYVALALGIVATIASFVFIGWIATECGGDVPADWCTE